MTAGRGRELVWGWTVAVAVGSVLLFWGGPGPLAPRSVGRLWDLGHVLLFYAAVRAALGASVWVRQLPPGRLWSGVLAVALVLGAATEAAQFLLGGDASWGDLSRDLLGAAAGLAFVDSSPPDRSRAAVRAAVAALLVIACVPAAAALWDEAAARREFPVLSNFESTLELSRWEGSAGRSLGRSRSRTGRGALRIELGTGEYSGASLRYFPGDWRGYRALAFSVFNPGPGALTLGCRIHDLAHLRGDQPYSDRFNRGFVLGPGWTDVEIPLADVAAAPEGRALDLGQVEGLGLFVHRLAAPRTIHLDAVRLVR